MNKVLCRRVFNTSSGMALNMKRTSESHFKCVTHVCMLVAHDQKLRRERENHLENVKRQWPYVNV